MSILLLLIPLSVLFVVIGGIAFFWAANRRQFEPHVEWRHRPEPALEALLFDPQTSGGLFLLVAEAESGALVDALPGARIVGRVEERGALPLVVA